MKLKDISVNPNNPRLIKDEKFKKLVASIKDFPKMMGLRPIIVDSNNMVLGGNMRFKALSELGYDNIPDDWVKKADQLTEEEKNRFIVEDNLSFGEWDWDILGNNFEIKDLLEWGFDEKELKIDRDVVEDEVPEVSDEPAVSKLGEVYQLGRHRLMCGNATKLADVEKLMNGQKADMVFTDPPYGINVVGDKGNVGGGTKQAPTTKFRKVIGDDIKFDPTFVIDLARLSFIWGGNYFADRLPRGGRWFVWDKNRPEGLSLSDCELAWSNIPGVKVQKFSCTWDGYHKEGESGTRVHPNQKPIKLLVNILKEITNENQTVLDLFGGSGSTLIACEQTNRTCYIMEIDPKYCDVIRKRYAKFIDKEDEWQTLTPKI